MNAGWEAGRYTGATMVSFWKRLFGKRSAADSKGRGSTVYLSLRAQALGTKAEEVGVKKGGVEAPFGLVTDWGTEAGLCTIVCFSTGDASIYTESGGGVIGGIGHERVRQAAAEALATAFGCKSQLQRAHEHPVPRRGIMRFALLTTSGTFAASAGVTELSQQRHALTPLGNAVQKLIYLLRQSAGPEPRAR